MNTKRIRQSGIVTFSLVCLGLMLPLQDQTVRADDQPQRKSSTEDAKPLKKDASDPEPSQRKSIDLKKNVLSQKLPVESIIEEMHRAGKLLEQQQTGKETQEVQQQVVQDLETLIRLIKSAPKNSTQRPSQKNDQKPDSKQLSGKQKGGMGEQSQQQISQGPARKSSERNEAGKVTPGDLTGRNAYIKDAWGHLPPAMRQKLLNIYTEKFLPQYEDQVRRYYEALAEKKKRTP
ncbi:hypothetical protein [Gimesia fumaroli]|jgi:hypothetical protein|uniref:Uncharacterized protein n=1 Tax=Gimesia fumaroli TaxID=2527976 RepID=A0A518IHF7_9PLAN|nr:hypothetical protein [Gimesia fumaroli]QDV52521.1 hypothetical protein Enr17x_45840 [Gimesia fumaroli]